MGVASVIRDYVEEMPATFGQDLDSQQQKVGSHCCIVQLYNFKKAFYVVIYLKSCIIHAIIIGLNIV